MRNAINRKYEGMEAVGTGLAVALRVQSIATPQSSPHNNSTAPSRRNRIAVPPERDHADGRGSRARPKDADTKCGHGRRNIMAALIRAW